MEQSPFASDHGSKQLWTELAQSKKKEANKWSSD